MNILYLISYSARELFILALILHPALLSNTLGEIAKTWGFEKAGWNHFTEISYFFGDPDAAFELCELNLARNNYDLYDTYLFESARMGNTEAQQIIFYDNKPKANTLADSIALELVNQQDIEAIVYLGERTLIHKKYDYAYELFMLALRKGKSKACGHLGFIFHKGLNRNKNDEMAMYYWKKGIEFHDPLSEYLYASTKMSKYKDKNSSEYREAIYYLVCSASHGLYLGQMKLSNMIKNAIDNFQTKDILFISRALKCHSSKSSRHFDNLFHMKNDFEEACY